MDRTHPLISHTPHGRGSEDAMVLFSRPCQKCHRTTVSCAAAGFREIISFSLLFFSTPDPCFSARKEVKQMKVKTRIKAGAKARKLNGGS